MSTFRSQQLTRPFNVRIFNKNFSQISCDSEKRDWTFIHRNLDLLAAGATFSGIHFTREDVRHDYGEIRFITVGNLCNTLVVMVWTDRFPALHVISLRKASRRERKAFKFLHQ
ncbi:MAG: BrnT family toxin [Burkholderiaceae bacterium]|jgi:uncharacterized DUF497 family protein